MLSFAILFCSLISCAPQPPDVPVFEHLHQRISHDPVTDHLLLTPDPVCLEEIGEAECGHGVFIISGKEIFIGEKKEHWFNGKPWSQLKSESIFVPAVESYAPMATYMINSCEKLKCNDDVDRFRVKFDSLRGVKDAAGGMIPPALIRP